MEYNKGLHNRFIVLIKKSGKWKVGWFPYPWERAPVPIVEAGWAPGQVWKGTEQRQCRNPTWTFQPATSHYAFYAISVPCIKRSHSIRGLSYDRPIASSKASSPKSAI
jgi:hypothetical protein